MLKKILLGALLVGLIGFLIAGAVVRTNAKGGEGETSGYGGRGRTAEAATALADDGGQYGGQGGRGQGASRSTTEVAPAPQADVTAEDWLTVQGTVVSVAEDLVEIETAAGEVIPFEGRPLSFAQEQGLTLQVGEKVQLTGFDEDGEFKIGQAKSLDSGNTVTLRDTSGRPGWAGRGRQGQAR